ncbi:MAG: hypothetical protein D4R50_01300 [Actinomycetales bacterium]|nr:MAG: hypothetical protein D4R50_01300 [Actinomycetales bacterium]
MALQKKVRGPRNIATTKKDKRANGEGSIYWDKSKNRWMGSAKDINGVMRKGRFLKRSEAEDFCHKLKQDRLHGKTTFVTDPKMKMSEFLTNWVDTKVFNCDSTERSYRGAIKNWIIPFIGQFKTGSIQAATIENMFAQLIAQDFSKGATDITWVVLSQAFKDGVRLHYLINNPMLNAKKIRRVNIPSQYIPKLDADRIYAQAMKDPYTLARTEAGMVMGIRPGEVLGLKWGDIDWHNSAMTISRQVQRVKGVGLVFQGCKTLRVRPIKLSLVQVEIFKAHQYSQMSAKNNWTEDENLLFPNASGKKLDDKSDQRLWKALLKDAGVVTKYRRYQMRKTAFTNMSANGVDVKTIMDYSNIRQASTLMNHYVFATTDSMKYALESQGNLRPNEEELELIRFNREIEIWTSDAEKNPKKESQHDVQAPSVTL